MTGYDARVVVFWATYLRPVNGSHAQRVNTWLFPLSENVTEFPPVAYPGHKKSFAVRKFRPKAATRTIHCPYPCWLTPRASDWAVTNTGYGTPKPGRGGTT
jgi:hypothetical protein